MPNLRVFLAIGREPHEGILRVLGLKPKGYKFAHGTMHELPNGQVLADSFHTSQYNVNTGRLTPAMFESVLGNIRGVLQSSRA
jgi:uracil-DNA glycosylase